MSQFNLEELSQLGKAETKTNHSISSTGNHPKRLPHETPVTHYGEVIGILSTIAEGMRCDCPEGHLHSDGLGEDYAHTVKLSGGEVGISCSGNSCNKLFIPDTPMISGTNTTYQKLDIGQLDTVPLLHFKPEMLPKPIRRWTLDNCMHAESSLSYAAASAIIVCSNLIGMKCQVKPKRNGEWKLTPNLWGMVIGEPSKRKSPVVEQFLKPLKKLEVKSLEAFNLKMREYEEKKVEYEIAQKAKKKKLQEAYESGDDTKIAKAKAIHIPILEEPKMKRFIINDATTEKTGEIMSTNPRTILQYRDELSGLFASFSKAGREGDRAFYLESFNGDSPYASDRIGRGTIHIEKLSLGLFGTIQPSVLAKYLISKNGDGGDGLAQRMQLAVFPDDVERPYYDEPIDKEAKDTAFKVIKRLAEESYEQLSGAELSCDGTPYFEFDDEAQALFIKWYDTMKQRESSEKNVSIQAHIGKYYGLLPSLALVFFLIDKVSGLCEATAIPIKYVEMAREWCEVLETHARKMYALADSDNTLSLEQKIINYVSNHQDILPKTFGELSGNIRGAKAEDVENALKDIALIEGKKVIKLL